MSRNEAITKNKPRSYQDINQDINQDFLIETENDYEKKVSINSGNKYNII